MVLLKKLKLKTKIYFKHVQKNSIFFNNLRRKYQQVKIYYNVNKSIRITGQIDEDKAALNDIQKFVDDFSKTIINSSDLEIKKSEFEYLLNQKNDIDKIQAKTNTIISVENIEKYVTLKFTNNTEIELYEGDLTKLNVDAYVNPSNNELTHNGGLAKAIIDAAGHQIQLECDQYVKKKGVIQDGDVYVTKSGNLGVNSESIIIHTVGPIWKEGINSEPKLLSKAVNACLIEANKDKCKSIAFPPISTGIFNYPVQEALKIITDTVLEYIMMNPVTSLKKVIFISNETSPVKEWNVILRNISVLRNIKAKPAYNKRQMSSRWYWKDDQGNWKAFISTLDDLIESNFRQYEKSNDKVRFDMQINGRFYTIDFKIKKQINKETKFLHDISNEIPNVSKYQWSWLDDQKNKSPFSVLHSETIESAFFRDQESVGFNIKRHDNDFEDTYTFDFAKNNPQVQKILADGIQINKRTNYKRFIFREQFTVKAVIEYPEDEDLISDVKHSLKVFVSGLENDVKEAIEQFQDLIDNAYVKEIFPSIEISETELKNLEKLYDAEISIIANGIAIKGLPNAVNEIKSKLLEDSIQKTKIIYPKSWGDQSENLKIVEVLKHSEEYKEIHNDVSLTIANPEIVKIERIQNKWLWKLYQKHCQILKEKGVNENETWLFHGTSNTKPEMIFDDQVGFDTRHSNAGMWGLEYILLLMHRIVK